MTTVDTAVVYAVAHRIATITLNRPDKLNALTAPMYGELIAAFDRADVDDEVRVIVVTGAGRAFCAGADLSNGSSPFDANQRTAEERAAFGTVGGVPRDRGGTISLRIAASRKPVIGAINGPAVGVGATMTLPMDIRIASDTARFGFVFARRGLVPEAASSWFLPRVVGISRAMEWVATGRVVPAEQAHAGGLVSRVVPATELLDAAYGIAREIAANTSGVAVAVARQLLWGMLGAANPWDAHYYDSNAIYALGSGEEAAEGVASFLEKRPPNFPLRVTADYPASIPPWPQRPSEY
jgi:enoyl-CoA hydratase/carnithine racemase